LRTSSLEDPSREESGAAPGPAPKSEYRTQRPSATAVDDDTRQGLRLPEPSTQGILAAGSRFGGYIVGACIGQGGMARIYRAEHEGLRRHVALKVLTEGFADKNARDRFLREARLAASIKHPNVVNIFDVGVHNGVPYLVMELLEGEDLEALLQSRGALDEGMIIDIMLPVVAGLMAVHEAGVVHRDLKPGNIFLTRGRNDEIEPKLLDFGISKADRADLLTTTSGSKTQGNGLIMGTPFYISPEAVQGREINARSDQYSIGVVLYECAAGFNPFTANTFAEVVQRITTGNYVPLSQHCPRISKRLSRIIERAMNLEPERRFANLGQVGRELLFLAGQRTRITWGLTFGENASLDGLDDSGAFGERQDSGRFAWLPRSRVASIALGLVALVAVAALVIGMTSGSGREPAPARAVDAPAAAPVARALEVEAALPLLPVGAEVRPPPSTAGEARMMLVRDSVPANDGARGGLALGDRAAPAALGRGVDGDDSEASPPARESKAAKSARLRERRARTEAARDHSTRSAGAAKAQGTRAPAKGGPASGRTQDQERPALGTNNAPIFD
jgi:tRNA A-37 threonylcarbamoyl transferase component Bud32